MFSTQARTRIFHPQLHSPGTPREAHQSKPWLLRACVCCPRYSYRHIFLHISQGPASELPTLQPRTTTKSPYCLSGLVICPCFLHLNLMVLWLRKTRFYNHDLEAAEVPKAEKGLVGASIHPCPAEHTHSSNPCTTTLKSGTKIHHFMLLAPQEKASWSQCYV